MSQPASPIVGILLAAGMGSRFGSDKLLHPLADGTPMALAAAQRLLPACDQVAAVLRPGSDTLAALLEAAGYRVVFSAESAQGMGHSLAAGVGATADAAGWVVALADMPFIETASHQKIADALRQGASLAAPYYLGQRGHPVGFAHHWLKQLAALDGDAGARALLAAAADQLVHCEVADSGVLRDVDRPDDLA